jgi:hypothetical protein
MIGNLMSRMADAEKLSIPQLQKSIQDGIIPAYVGVPLLQDKMRQEKAKAVPQQPAQPPIAQQVMAEAAQHGIDSAPSNLPTEMAGGGIVAFDDGGLANEQEEDEEYGGMNAQDSALLAKYMAGITADSGSELDEDEEMPEGIVAAMPRGKETENRGVGLNPEKKGASEGIQYTSKKHKHEKEIREAARNAGISEDLFLHMMAKETGGLDNPESARSKAGAMGIAQFMPATAKQYGIDPMDMKQALPAAAKMTSNLLKHYGGDQRLAAMAYNWGQGNVDKWLASGADPSKVPGETQKYTRAAEGGIMKLAGGGVVAFGSPKLNPNEDQLVNDTNDNPYALMGDIGMLTPSYTKDKRSILDKTLRGIALPPEKPAIKPTAPAPFTPPTQQELDTFDAASRAFEKEQMGKPDKTDIELEDINPEVDDNKALREMLTERAKSAKNQKSIDNYMALLQAGLGMMGGTSPYAAANIGQGASKGIAHLADARKSQIAEENALLSGRLGLSRAQLLETSRRNALEQQARRDALNYGLGVQKVKNQTTALDLKRNQLLGKAESDLVKEGEFDSLKASYKERFGKNWERDTLHKAAFEREKLAKIKARASGYADEVEGIPNYNQVK